VCVLLCFALLLTKRTTTHTPLLFIHLHHDASLNYTCSCTQSCHSPQGGGEAVAAAHWFGKSICFECFAWRGLTSVWRAGFFVLCLGGVLDRRSASVCPDRVFYATCCICGCMLILGVGGCLVSQVLLSRSLALSLFSNKKVMCGLRRLCRRCVFSRLHTPWWMRGVVLFDTLSLLLRARLLLPRITRRVAYV
jgi:hypothetical protein